MVFAAAGRLIPARPAGLYLLLELTARIGPAHRHTRAARRYPGAGIGQEHQPAHGRGPPAQPAYLKLRRLAAPGVSRTVDAARPDGAADMAIEPIRRGGIAGEAGYVASGAT